MQTPSAPRRQGIQEKELRIAFLASLASWRSWRSSSREVSDVALDQPGSRHPRNRHSVPLSPRSFGTWEADLAGALLQRGPAEPCAGRPGCVGADQLMFQRRELQDHVRSEHPMAALEMLDARIVQADYDEPALKATIAEAQQRWPEFAAAFAQRKADQQFGVKLKFDEGDET